MAERRKPKRIAMTEAGAITLEPGAALPTGAKEITAPQRGASVTSPSGLSLTVRPDASGSFAPGARTSTLRRLDGSAMLTDPRSADQFAGSEAIRNSLIEGDLEMLAEQEQAIGKIPDAYRTAGNNSALRQLHELQAAARLSRDKYQGYLPPAGGRVGGETTREILQRTQLPEHGGVPEDVTTMQPGGTGDISYDFTVNETARRGAQREANDTGRQVTRSIGGKLMTFRPIKQEGVEGVTKGVAVPKVIVDERQRIKDAAGADRLELVTARKEAQKLKKQFKDGNTSPALENNIRRWDARIRELEQKISGGDAELTQRERDVRDWVDKGVVPEWGKNLAERAQPGYEPPPLAASDAGRAITAARAAAKAAKAGKGKVAKDTLKTIRTYVASLKGTDGLVGARKVYDAAEGNAALMKRIPALAKVASRLRLNPKLKDDPAKFDKMLANAFGLKVPKGRAGYTLKGATGNAYGALMGADMPDSGRMTSDNKKIPYTSYKDFVGHDATRAAAFKQQGGLTYDAPQEVEGYRKKGDVGDEPARRRSMRARWHSHRKLMKLNRVSRDDTRRSWEAMIMGQTKQVKEDWDSVRKGLGIAPIKARLPKDEESDVLGYDENGQPVASPKSAKVLPMPRGGDTVEEGKRYYGRDGKTVYVIKNGMAVRDRN